MEVRRKGTIPRDKKRVAPCKGNRILESEKFLFVKCGILGTGIRNTAQGIRNPSYDWNPESQFQWRRFRRPKSTALKSLQRWSLTSNIGGHIGREKNSRNRSKIAKIWFLSSSFPGSSRGCVYDLFESSNKILLFQLVPRAEQFSTSVGKIHTILSSPQGYIWLQSISEYLTIS